MKKIHLLLVLGVFFLFLANASMASSADIKTNYYIYENKVLVEHSFEGQIKNFDLAISSDASNLEINAEYKLEDFEGRQVIKINFAEDISIKYITESIIDKSRKEFFFTSINRFSEAQSQDVKLVLPESALLVEGGLVFPEPDLISSDGRSIILEWDNYSEDQIIVNYEFPEKDNSLFYIILFAVILFFVVYNLIQNKKFFKKVKEIKNKNKKVKTKEYKTESLTKNLFEDEKKIVEYLLTKKNNEVWTKEILKDLGISKVKLSRKLRSLEQKEIIKRIPYGNENRIRLKIK